jgi:predicted transcriptional regulator
MSRDLIIDMQISINVSEDYNNKLNNMTDQELARHISKSCFKNNDRFLMNYKIINGDKPRFKQVNLKKWFENLKKEDNYYLKEEA